MAGEQYLTRSHDVIRRWADARGARPSTVVGTHTPTDPGVIRLDTPDHDSGDRLEAIEWRDWFTKFDAGELVLLYQETTSDGSPSGFNKLIEADAAAAGIPGAEWVDDEEKATGQ